MTLIISGGRISGSGRIGGGSSGPAQDGYYEDGQLVAGEPDGYWADGTKIGETEPDYIIVDQGKVLISELISPNTVSLIAPTRWFPNVKDHTGTISQSDFGVFDAEKTRLFTSAARSFTNLGTGISGLNILGDGTFRIVFRILSIPSVSSRGIFQRFAVGETLATNVLYQLITNGPAELRTFVERGAGVNYSAGWEIPHGLRLKVGPAYAFDLRRNSNGDVSCYFNGLKLQSVIFVEGVGVAQLANGDASGLLAEGGGSVSFLQLATDGIHDLYLAEVNSDSQTDIPSDWSAKLAVFEDWEVKRIVVQESFLQDLADDADVVTMLSTNGSSIFDYAGNFTAANFDSNSTVHFKFANDSPWFDGTARLNSTSSATMRLKSDLEVVGLVARNNIATPNFIWSQGIVSSSNTQNVNHRFGWTTATSLSYTHEYGSTPAVVEVFWNIPGDIDADEPIHFVLQREDLDGTNCRMKLYLWGELLPVASVTNATIDPSGDSAVGRLPELGDSTQFHINNNTTTNSKKRIKFLRFSTNLSDETRIAEIATTLGKKPI
jgi:hypothetical protein